MSQYAASKQLGKLYKKDLMKYLWVINEGWLGDL